MPSSGKVSLAFMVLLLSISGSAFCQEVFTLHFGATTFVSSSRFPALPADEFDVGTTGFSTGFMIPIRFPAISAHYKVAASFHKVRDTEFVFSDLEEFDKYIGITNEFLIGRTFLKQSAFPVTPQIGFGFLFESVYPERGRGYMYDFFFLDFAATVRHAYKGFNFGLMASFITGFAENVGYYEAKRRINFSFLFSI
jgi:hypothetical protein